MRNTGVQAIGALGLAALSTAFASACSVPVRTDSGARPAARSTALTTAAPIAQLDFGRQAAFASCLSPPCPAVTPKTLATDTPDTAQGRALNHRVGVAFERDTEAL